jgi:galactose mutarotase-like enzyme
MTNMTQLSTPSHDSDWLTLASAELTAQVNPLGAQLSALKDGAGRDLLWDGNPAIWAGRAPLLFPIVGALHGGSYRLGSNRYSLSRHGFARGSRFAVIDTGPARATFRLTADDASRRLYPFEFELDVGFVLEAATLSIESTIRNRGDVSMPASLGYHPAFRWPLPFGQNRSAHYIEFESDEPAPARRLNGEGLLAPEPVPTPIVNRRLALADELFRNDAIVFDDIRSRRVTYGADQGARIGVSFPDSPYLGVWTKPGANFICIEPWNGIADPHGFSDDFALKPGVFQVAPSASRSIKIAISLLGG